MRKYDEVSELMGYVWRNYPEIMRPHECAPSAEMICEELPEELREEYWRHAMECRRIVEESRKADRTYSSRGGVRVSTPDLPETRPELTRAFHTAFENLQRKIFWSKFEPYEDQVAVNRCDRCGRILVCGESRQCLWCGHDWH